jgi:hypothetical protein
MHIVLWARLVAEHLMSAVELLKARRIGLQPAKFAPWSPMSTPPFGVRSVAFLGGCLLPGATVSMAVNLLLRFDGPLTDKDIH